MNSSQNFRFIITVMGLAVITVIFSFRKGSDLNTGIGRLEFDPQSIYLIQRGTTGKLGNLAKDFNLKNKYASHLGIGFLKDDQLVVYHVYVDRNKKNDSNLYIENLENFTKPEDLNYISIWKLKDISPEQVNAVKNSLYSSEKETIHFDFTFDESDKAYYCTEFVVKQLKKNHIEIMHEHKKGTVGMVKQILKKDTLTYFPVDGFENTGKAAKIFEWVKS